MNDEYEERDLQRGRAKDFFTEADCEHFASLLRLDEANRLLRERGRAVYGHETGTCVKWYSDNVVDASVGAKHTALLINSQPIEQDSAEKVLAYLVKEYERSMGGVPRFLEVGRKAYERAKAILAREK